MRFLFDTDHISFLQRETGAEFVALQRRLSLHVSEDLAISVVSFHEQSLGAHNYINQARTSDGIVRGYDILFRVIRMSRTSPLVPFDDDAMLVYQKLMTLRLRLNRMDLRIAAIALSRDLTLLTRNVSDFGKINDLRTEDWTR